MVKQIMGAGSFCGCWSFHSDGDLTAPSDPWVVFVISTCSKPRIAEVRPSGFVVSYSSLRKEQD